MVCIAEIGSSILCHVKLKLIMTTLLICYGSKLITYFCIQRIFVMSQIFLRWVRNHRKIEAFFRSTLLGRRIWKSWKGFFRPYGITSASPDKNFRKIVGIFFEITCSQIFFIWQKSTSKSPIGRRSGRKTPQKSQKLI